MIVNLSSKPKE
uniref:Uncharacterized protein n=1 Tax=Anguilla anguilla TaxID=7936 RepID=A0A0E9XYW7_ANGAN